MQRQQRVPLMVIVFQLRDDPGESCPSLWRNFTFTPFGQAAWHL